ncbi:MAG TPA: hypothetical protein VK053_17750, partial [Jiangellaceae bacterium]|nr:hypothetical protein [Jiangellaceae bacterium]
MAHSDSVTLDRLQAISYRSSNDAPRGRRRRFTNALVVVDALGADQEEIRGLGEALFRGRETGDRTEQSWKFLTECLELLHGRTIDCRSKQAALSSIETVMAELSRRARERQPERRPRIGFDKRSARRLVKQAAERTG